MKSLIALFTITSAFFLMSCSNVDQDLSPVGPEIEKNSVPDVTGTYPYLTSFTSIPVDGFTAGTRGGAIEIVVDGSRGWSDVLEHIYVMLEYYSDTNPSPDKMVYLERPASTTFKLEGFETRGLKSVKVYCYEPATDPGVQSPYHPLNYFSDVYLQWSASPTKIEVNILDNSRKFGDTFAEITTDEGSFVVFIGIPSSTQITIPINSDPSSTRVIIPTGVRLFNWAD